MQAAPTGDPVYAPASNAIHASAAVIVPSFFAPILILVCEPGVGPVASKTSPRDISSLTGRPDFFDKIAATGGRYTEILPPNPPPISCGTTLTLEIGT